jgi:hypothetical protein
LERRVSEPVQEVVVPVVQEVLLSKCDKYRTGKAPYKNEKWECMK